ASARCKDQLRHIHAHRVHRVGRPKYASRRGVAPLPTARAWPTVWPNCRCGRETEGSSRGRHGRDAQNNKPPALQRTDHLDDAPQNGANALKRHGKLLLTSVPLTVSFALCSYT